MPDQLLQKIAAPDFNFNSSLLISINDLSLEPEIRQIMNHLLEPIPAVTMETLYNYYQDSEALYRRTSLVIWGLSGFIMLFAVINLINTLIATTLSRKHEFSALRSIGMGKKQLQWTIQWEGILLAFWNIGITLSAGTAVGYGMVRYLNNVGDDTWVWRFPLAYFIGYAIISVILPVIISAVMIHILQKKPVVEQLRENN